jgi:hypothetical protein
MSASVLPESGRLVVADDCMSVTRTRPKPWWKSSKTRELVKPGLDTSTIEVPKEPPKSVLSAAAKLDQNLLIKMRKVGIGLSLPFVRSGARAPFEIVILISRRSSWRDRCGNDLLSSAN